MCHDNCYVFCSFFIRYRHAPSPSRVGTNEGLLRPHFPYSMSSCAWKTSFLRLSFTTYIRSYFGTKNDQIRQEFGLVPNTSAPPAAAVVGSLCIQGVVRRWQRLAMQQQLLQAARLHGNAAVHPALLANVNRPAPAEFPWVKWLAFAFNNEQLKALVMPPTQLLLYQTAVVTASAAAFSLLCALSFVSWYKNGQTGTRALEINCNSLSRYIYAYEKLFISNKLPIL